MNSRQPPPIRYVREESLGYHSARVSKLLLKRIGERFAARDVPIRPEEFPFLSYLWGNDGQTQKELAQSLFREKTGVAKIALRLESIGLIRREPGLRDGREKRIFFTEEGLNIMEEVAELVYEILEEGQKGIPEDDLNTCKAVLRRVFQNLRDT